MPEGRTVRGVKSAARTVALPELLAARGEMTLDDFFQIRSPGAAPDGWQVCVHVSHAASGLWLLLRYGARDSAPAGGGEEPDARSEHTGALC
ncbi:hypothetical protein M2271_000345 [Streptomyces sp. LBL]|uniref:hypothetical protein n=1 Tax=Streptomyces sp. LBL TaxID=2940562 RepID=UPI00247401BD|nr:hypothetical protein [Streptomyces sp. LBL]MDH6622558.1 hypothetical protein [Streptomyces sp. LBL]